MLNNREKKPPLRILCVIQIATLLATAVSINVAVNQKGSIESLEEDLAQVNRQKRRLGLNLNEVKEETEKLKEDNQDLNNKLEEANRDLEKTKDELHRERNKKQPSRGSDIKVKGREIGSFTATAYCGCSKCNGKWTGMPTASGTGYSANETIAVDPRVIPLGSKVYIEGVGVRIAQDTGSAIKGNIIDIYHNSHKEALNFGRKRGLKVTIIE